MSYFTILFSILFSSSARADVIVTSPQDHSTSRVTCAALLAPSDPFQNEVQAGFLRAIAANPGDDMNRLVYADWLEEHGENDLAEFIRLQVREATTSVARQRELATRHQHEWIPQRIAGENWTYVFMRGFIEEISLPFDVQNAERLRALFEQIPTLKRVHFTRNGERQATVSRTTFSHALARAPGLPSLDQGSDGVGNSHSITIWSDIVGTVHVRGNSSRSPQLLVGLYSQDGRLLSLHLAGPSVPLVIPEHEIPVANPLVRILGY